MSGDQQKLIRRTFFSVTLPHLLIALGQILKKRKEKKRKGRKMVEKSEQTLRDLWDNIKSLHIYVIRVPKEEKENGMKHNLKK